MSDENKPECETIQTAPDSFYDLKCKDIDGNWVLLSKFKDAKAILVVNVASLCTYTDSNYKQLDQIREEFKDKGLEVLAFPCNQFQSQEPGNHEEIKKFVNENYNVKFPIFEKIDVNGKNTHPIYCWLRSHSELNDKVSDQCQKIQWNFEKFLLNKEGKIVKVFKPSKDLTPVRQAIQEVLNESSGSTTENMLWMVNYSKISDLNTTLLYH